MHLERPFGSGVVAGQFVRAVLGLLCIGLVFSRSLVSVCNFLFNWDAM